MPTPNSQSIHGRREAPGADGVGGGLDTNSGTSEPAQRKPSSPNQNRTGQKTATPETKEPAKQNENKK